MQKINVSWSADSDAANCEISLAALKKHAPFAIKVVLVDDSSLVRLRLAALLSSLDGVAITGQAENITIGRLLLEQQNPDVLILDINFPGENGLTLLKFARLRDKSLKIIMLSSNNHPKLREKCAELGANFYFHKPTEIENAFDVCRELASCRAVNP